MAVFRSTSIGSWMLVAFCGYMVLLLYIFFALQPDVHLQFDQTEVGHERDAHLQIRSFREKRFRRYALYETKRTGCGEHGTPVSLSETERAVGSAQGSTEGYSLIASDKVALDRALKDMRHEQCRSLTYPDDLPTVSVIIIFADEARSVLMRTVHSVVNRTPPRLLQEVILVDDASTKAYLLEELDAYVAGAWPDGIVRVLRLPTRSGLIRARLAGARAATGDAIAVLDGHIEVTKGWAEPLLARIKEKPTTLVTPVVDSVHPDTLEYVIGDPKATVTFRWDMHYEWLPYKAKDNISAIPSASMVGCAFAMDRHMFFKLGSFDEDMEVWGCENTEIGFRLWMCGGGMEIVPCSRLAHLFRKARPYKTPPKLDYYGINSQRVAEVWLDKYRRYYYYAKPERQNSTYGNITKRLALKEKLKCKSFRWFMTEAFPDSFVYDKNVQGWGYVKSLGNNMCLDSFGKDEQMNFQLQMYPCQTNHATHFTQLFSLTNDHRLRRQFSCATYPGSSPGQNITMAYSCYHNYSLPWKWDYKQDTKQIVYSSNGFCLDSSPNNVPTLSPCTNTTSQQWTFQYKGDS